MKAALHVGLVLAALVLGNASSAEAQQRAAGYVTGTGTININGTNYAYESFGGTLLWIHGFQGTQVIVVELSQTGQYWDAATQSYYHGISWTSYETGGRYDYSGYWRGAYSGHFRFTENGLYCKVDYRNFAGVGDNWQPVHGSQYWPVY